MTTLLSRFSRNARSAAEYLSAYAHEFERAAALYRAMGQDEDAAFNETMAREFTRCAQIAQQNASMGVLQ